MRIVRVDVFARRRRWVCVSIVGISTFARYVSASERLIFALDNCSLPFAGVLVVAYVGVCILGRCIVARSTDIFIRYVVLVHGGPTLLNGYGAMWPIRPWEQLVVRRFFRHFRIARTHREWPVKKYSLVCFEYRCFANAVVVIVCSSVLRCGQSTVNLFSHEG